MHYLVTLDLLMPARLHAYVISKDKQDAVRAGEKLMDYAEKQGLPSLGIMLVTGLSDDGVKPDPVSVAFVRKVASAVDPRIAEALARAKDFHFSAWMMPTDHPDDRPLMELH